MTSLISRITHHKILKLQHDVKLKHVIFQRDLYYQPPTPKTTLCCQQHMDINSASIFDKIGNNVILTSVRKLKMPLKIVEVEGRKSLYVHFPS